MAQTLKQFKASQEHLSEERLKSTSYPHELTIVAEGDSWFSYPLKKDIIDYLIQDGFAIKNFAKAGDTLENMIYGTEYEKDPNNNNHIKHKGPLSLQKTLSAIKNHKPTFVLFSAGGNDIVGSEMVNYLHHKHAHPTSLVNDIVFKEKLAQMKTAITFFVESVHKTHGDCHILMDGYDYAKVNGKGYKFIFNNIKGPWIQPAMGAKAITNPIDQRAIILQLVDGYNEMLKDLASKYSYFHHIDLRGLFPDEALWDNEIHLKNTGFRQVATLYRKKIESILGADPIKTFEAKIIA